MRLARSKYQEVHPFHSTLNERELYRSAAIHYIEMLTSKVFAIPVDCIRSKKRGNAIVSFARHTSMYLAHVALSFSLNEVGIAFKRDRTTVVYACRMVEDERDDPAFDAMLDTLEIELNEWKRHWAARY